MSLTDRYYEERNLVYIDEETTSAQAAKLINKFGISNIIMEDRPKSNKGIGFLTQCPSVTSLEFHLTIE
ncbi:hypothetical protein MNBD_GAMMA12-2290, partial [hydrothermal vent metagenome]